VSSNDNPLRQLAALAEAAANALADWAERTGAVTAEAGSNQAKDPAVRAIRDTWRIGPIWARRYCECPCVRSHPADLGVCDGHAVLTRRVTTSKNGEAELPLCAPCAVAQGFAEQTR
jgi:hypothetical protein